MLELGYLTGGLILGVVYLVLYLWRKDLRREMLWGGLLVLPFALTAPFFIPEYWNPPYLLQLGTWELGVEDFVFCYFAGGLAAVVYEVVLNRREVKIRRRRSWRLWIPYVGGIGLYLLLELVLPAWSVVSLGAVGVVTGAYMVATRHDLLAQSLTAGVLFTLLYFAFFNLFNYLFPTYVELVYQHQNMLGVYVVGVPLEELLFAFGTGVGWSVGYEYILGYRTNKR